MSRAAAAFDSVSERDWSRWRLGRRVVVLMVGTRRTDCGRGGVEGDKPCGLRGTPSVGKQKGQWTQPFGAASVRRSYSTQDGKGFLHQGADKATTASRTGIWLSGPAYPTRRTSFPFCFAPRLLLLFLQVAKSCCLHDAVAGGFFRPGGLIEVVLSFPVFQLLLSVPHCSRSDLTTT